MTPTPVFDPKDVDPRPAEEMTAPRYPTIAIIGSGPSGCYTAQALRKQFPDSSITIFDRLPVPFGLVRFGVAADHQGTKNVTRQFDRMFSRGDIRFVGNVAIGADIDFSEIRSAFDITVIATGLHVDRELGIPGEVLPGVAGAGRITRLLNSHPDESHESYRALGARVAVIGHGNVAIDLVRLLTKRLEELDESDINDASHQALSRGMQELHSIGRSAVENAKFDDSMVHELIGLEGVRHVVHYASEDYRPSEGSARAKLFEDLCKNTNSARGEVHWWFGFHPIEISGDQTVSSLHIRNAADDRQLQLNVDGVITAIGFTGETLADVDDGAKQSGRIEPGLYVAGWARRGPRGTIAAQRTDARGLAAAIADDVESLPLDKTGWDAVAKQLPNATDYEGWQRIDAHERATAAPGRVRQKVANVESMINLAGS